MDANGLKLAKKFGPNAAPSASSGFDPFATEPEFEFMSKLNGRRPVPAMVVLNVLSGDARLGAIMVPPG